MEESEEKEAAAVPTTNNQPWVLPDLRSLLASRWRRRQWPSVLLWCPVPCSALAPRRPFLLFFSASPDERPTCAIWPCLWLFAGR
jgi:hypothetical protein